MRDFQRLHWTTGVLSLDRGKVDPAIGTEAATLDYPIALASLRLTYEQLEVLPRQRANAVDARLPVHQLTSVPEET